MDTRILEAINRTLLQKSQLHHDVPGNQLVLIVTLRWFRFLTLFQFSRPVETCRTHHPNRNRDDDDPSPPGDDWIAWSRRWPKRAPNRTVNRRRPRGTTVRRVPGRTGRPARHHQASTREGAGGEPGEPWRTGQVIDFLWGRMGEEGRNQYGT